MMWVIILTVMLMVTTIQGQTPAPAPAPLDPLGVNVCFTVTTMIQEYYTSCGVFGWDRCHRTRVLYFNLYHCCPGYSRAFELGSDCPIPWCIGGWNICPNGGTCTQAYHCDCLHGFYSPDCEACTPIENCYDLRCTSNANQYCHTCNFQHSPLVRAYEPVESDGLADRVCKQLCSWRPDSKQCYPGKCTDGTPDTCQCTPGFGGEDCKTMTDIPQIAFCWATITDSSDETADLNCQISDSPTKYTNNRAAKLNVDWKSLYLGPAGTGPPSSANPPAYPYPVYVNDYDVGLVAATVEWTITRGSSTVSSGSIPCGTMTPDDPKKSILSCDDDGQLSTSLLSDDILELLVKSTNGGRLQINNFDSSALTPVIENQYFHGNNKTSTSTFTFDFDPPYHCLGSCGHNMLDRGKPFTKQALVTIQWHGWADAISGVKKYQYEVYKLKPIGAGATAQLDYKTEPSLVSVKVDSLPSTAPTFTLPELGMYCILLIVYDGAHSDPLQANHRIARRFLLFDDSSQVEISDHSDHQMFVNSAAANTSYEWVTTLTAEVSIQWNDHFFNEPHRSGMLLNGIASHSTDIHSDYEEGTGQPHATRSMEAIPNVNGIVRYDFLYATDHDGGRTLTAPSGSWETLTNLNEAESRVISRIDGDSIKFWVKAFDVMNTTSTDEVLVHVDSTPAHVENAGLLRGDQKLLVVHSSVDLFDMVLEFETYDYHSGVKQITWELLDMSDLTKHGDGAIPVVRAINAADAGCVTPECYCIEKDEECFKRTYQIAPELNKLDIAYGIHDGDYVYVITVVNNAMLQTVYTIQITIDISPPLTGEVLDAKPGNTDLDFQSPLLVPSWWKGFFDRESGIKYYRYATHTSCLTASDFASGGTPASAGIATTFNTFASHSVTEGGTYYTTVVAYNHALEPSDPVCSDGVTIDTTPPEVASINIKDAHVKPGLVKDGEKMMYMDEGGYVYELEVQTEDCSSRLVNDLSLYESRTFPEPIRPYQVNCSSYGPAGERHYMARENMFEMTWSGAETESTIHDYKIALSSTESALGNIMPPTSSQGHEYLITYHPNLVDFEEFYVSVTATNKAGLETKKTVGPFQVRITGPAFDGEMTVSHETTTRGEFLVVSFPTTAYDNNDIDQSYLESIEYSLGEGACSGDLIAWTVIDNPVNSFGCDNTWPQTCVHIDPDVQGFHLNQNTDYCLSVRLQAYNKLVTSSTVSYRHDQARPPAGMLWEIDASNEDLIKRDVNYQTSTNTLHLRFIPHRPTGNLNQNYFIGVGTTPEDDSVNAFSSVDVEDVIEIQNLTLQFNTMYFTTLKIVDSDNGQQSLVSSNGITVLPEDTELPSFIVNDGVPCTNANDLDEAANHHTNLEDVPSCDVEIDYQTYTTSLTSYWSYNSTDSYVQYFLVSVEKKDDSAESTWVPVLSNYYIGNEESVTLSGLYLEGGETYHVVVQGCHPAGCYQPKATDGVVILPTEPVSKDILDVEYNETDISFTVTWNPFADPYHGIDFDVISQYAIAIFVRQENSEDLNQITQWIHLQEGDYNVDPSTQQINTTYTLDHPLEASSCLLIAIRGYNRAMLYSTSYKEFLGCTVPERYNLIVFDAVGERQADGTIGDVLVVGNEDWTGLEAEYTSSTTSLSAVWGREMRHASISWSLVEERSDSRVAYKKKNLRHLDYSDFDCSFPEALVCGRITTGERYLNVHGLELKEGHRYHICLRAPMTTISNEHSDEVLPEVSVCSNGVTVDTQPPIAGTVWIGDGTHQSETLKLIVYWTSFVDVEVTTRTAHHSGIKTYFLAIGSSRYTYDVLEFQDVGLTNIKVITGLSLSGGQKYYATIKAQDYVGHETLVTSEAVTIDSTPPDVRNDKVIVSGNYLTNENSVQIQYANGAFTDPESGIAEYKWCIGSKPNLCDTMARTKVSEPILSVTSDTAVFVDGQDYYVNVQATNGAGLVLSTTAATFIVDFSPPIAGWVWEVGADPTVDIDYQMSSNSLSLAWGDFSDVESHILEYRLSIGSCKTCTDILDDVYVGKVEAYSLDHLKLTAGTKYHTQVKARNGANQWTVAWSDGLTADGTPPHLGRIYDGIFDEDKDYHAKNDVVSVHLENLHDMQSHISVVTWWTGTVSGGSDIFPEEITHSHTVLQHSLAAALPDGTTIYATVKACNRAGLCVQKSSDGSTVDTTAASITGDIELVPTAGILLPNHPVYRNTLSIQWTASEDISPIVLTYICVLPQDDAHLDLPTVKLLGNPESHTLAGLDLRDGDLYVVKVTICNAASLCAEKVSSDIKVDSSPSTSGAFAVDTEHAIELSRQRDGWMTYDNDGPAVKLAWVGFQDPHSDVLEYSVKIGTGFYTTDIGEKVTTHQTSDAHGDEGFVVTESVVMSRPLEANDQIYITITATNNAGLPSTILHGLFTAVPSGGATGILELMRRCPALSCVGHCMCAPHGFQGCDVTGSTCTDRTGEDGYAAVTVLDTIPSQVPGDVSDVDYIPTLHILMAKWTVESGGTQPNYFEWSVGRQGSSPGSGLLDMNTQPTWHEAGTNMEAIFSMANSKLADEMSTLVTYVFYVKAWYDANNYAIFPSDGVQADSTAPELSDSYSVIEVTESDPTSSADVDFTASATEITVKWENVFRDGQSGLESFDVMIYSNKMLSVIESTQVDGDIEQFTFSGLNLIQGEHYHSIVISCNKAKLCTEASSDGFLLDTTPPYPGTVLDPRIEHDEENVPGTDEVLTSWQGFYDDESSIHHFMRCVIVDDTEVGCDDVGIYQKKTMPLPDDIENGAVVTSTVYAVNGAMLSSNVVHSGGFIYDKTPPTDSQFFNFGDDIGVSGNFANGTDNWEVDAKHTEVNGNTVCLLTGHIKQDVPTVVNKKYRLQFEVFNGFESMHSEPSFGYVIFGQKEYHVYAATNKNDALHFRKQMLYVTAHGSTSVVEFGTMTDMKICLANIKIEPVSEGLRTVENSNHPESSFNSSVHVKVLASSMGSTVVMNWDFEDFETPVVDYMVAMGTVQGGIQIQDFKSTGRHQTATVAGLKLQHGTVIFVTVVATNAARLSVIVHADPVVVDLTPPVIEVFQVNSGNAALASLDLSFDWQADDQESGIKECKLSIDSDNDLASEVTFLSQLSSGSDTVSLPELNDGDVLHCKMTCESYRGLFAQKTAAAVTYVSQGSNTDNANIVIMPYSETYHRNRDNYFPSADMLWFRWDGIVDPIGIESCEMMVTKGDESILEISSLGSNQHRTAVLQNTSTIFEDNTPYTLKLTCLNGGGYATAPITTEFQIDPAVPVYSGNPMGVFWPSPTKVELNWSGLFPATASPVYEVHLGTTPGGRDVLSWLETTDTKLEVTDINSAVVHYFSISAISQSGLYVTSTFVVQY